MRIIDQAALQGRDKKLQEKIGPRYTLHAYLGGTSSSRHYIVKDTRFRKTYRFLKVLLDPQNAKARERFLQEGEAHAVLGGEVLYTGQKTIEEDFRIPRLVDFLEDEKDSLLITEFVIGIDLERKILGDTASTTRTKQHDFTPKEATRIITSATYPLERAHYMGVIHRDVKPSNLLLTPDDEVHLADFGLIKAGTYSGIEHRATDEEGQGLGTPLFMAPEQTMEGTEHTTRIDVHALGATYFFLLTGRGLFETAVPGGTVVPTMAGLLHALQHSERPKASATNPAVPKCVDEIIEQATAINPDDRFRTVIEMREALERIGARLH